MTKKSYFFFKSPRYEGSAAIELYRSKREGRLQPNTIQKVITFCSLPLFLVVAAVYQRMMAKSECIIIDTGKLKFLQGHQEVHVLLYYLEPNEAVCDFTEHWRQMITAVLQVDGDSQCLCETSFYVRVCCSGMDKCVMGVQTLVSSFWLGSACINKCNFKSQSHSLPLNSILLWMS